jgi:tryptophan 2,3-dioxygenase
MQQPGIYTASDLTYNRYLKVDELLQMQQLESNPPHHDELLFIIIHQTYELWFKLILKELEQAQVQLKEGLILKAHHFIKRVVEIQKHLVKQIHILETMTPVDFLSFRDALNPASGFQSFQFREIEFFLGLKDESYFTHFKDKTEPGYLLLKQRFEAEDLMQTVKQTVLKRFNISDEQFLKSLEGLYRRPEADLELYLLLEALMDLDTQLSLWRYHHVMVVERIIGSKTGTGGSSGSAYLRSTITKKCFPELWALRLNLETHVDETSVNSPSSEPKCPFGFGTSL